MQAAKARGVTTSFDLIAPNEETLELLRPLLPSVDYFMPSLEEAAFLSGETQPEAIGRFFPALGVGTCILKDGENGSGLSAAMAGRSILRRGRSRRWIPPAAATATAAGLLPRWRADSA